MRLSLLSFAYVAPDACKIPESPKEQPCAAANVLMLSGLCHHVACNPCHMLKPGQSKPGSSAQGNHAQFLSRLVGFRYNGSLGGLTSTELSQSPKSGLLTDRSVSSCTYHYLLDLAIFNLDLLFLLLQLKPLARGLDLQSNISVLNPALLTVSVWDISHADIAMQWMPLNCHVHQTE